METKNNINIEDLKTFIIEIERTKEYDDSRIPEYYEQIFGKEERSVGNEPCSLMQMRKMKAWYQDQKKR